MNFDRSNSLDATISQALEDMKEEHGGKLDLESINLSELSRRTGITRHRLRKLKEDGFVIKPHALKGTHKEHTVLTGYTGIIDDELRKGIDNSNVIKDILDEHGYTGCTTQVKEYIRAHRDLMPPKRQIVASQGNRGRRYTSAPGECFQMDWGFVNVETADKSTYRSACFAMICHHCGERYIEFFPNAKQENLFIGMIHGFQRMGIPKYVLTDNMKSVVIKRDADKHPIWNAEYENFMKTVGFQTKLCKPAHPFTKGAVERLVKFVKNNFMAGRTFGNITDLNYDALHWCDVQNRVYHKGVNCVPEKEHSGQCRSVMTNLIMIPAIRSYLCPQRKITFDGFVNFEGRRFGVPYWYHDQTARICREENTIHIYSVDLSKELVRHNVTWSRKDSFCKDQYADEQPEEFPTAPVTTVMRQKDTAPQTGDFSRFNFDKEVEM